MYCIVTVMRFVIILIKFYVCMYVCMKQWLDFCGNPDLLPDPEIVNTIILTDLQSRTLRVEYSWLLLSTRNAISVDVIFFIARRRNKMLF